LVLEEEKKDEEEKKRSRARLLMQGMDAGQLT